MLFGAFNISGNRYSPFARMMIQRTAGQTFEIGANYFNDKRNPNVVTTENEIPVIFSYYWRNVDVWSKADNLIDIDPNHWDNFGELSVVPDGYWTIQPLMFYAPTIANDIQYGQAIYSTFDLARIAITSPIDINPYNQYDTFRGWLIVQQGCTDITDLSKCIIITAGNLGLMTLSESAGPQGPQGVQGAQGAQGPGVGAQGAQGNQGVNGSVGSQGNQGNQGNQGAQGNQGTQGNQGGQGTQGNQGNQGAQVSGNPQWTQSNSLTGHSLPYEIVDQSRAINDDGYYNYTSAISVGTNCTYTVIADVVHGSNYQLSLIHI